MKKMIVLLFMFILFTFPPLSYAEGDKPANLDFTFYDVYYKDNSLIVEGILANTGNATISNINKFAIAVYDSNGILIDGTLFENHEELSKVNLEPGHYENWSFEIEGAAQKDITNPEVTYEAEFDQALVASYLSGIHVFVNNERLQTDVNPVIVNGRTLVPMRAIFEQLGAAVTYDQNTFTVTAKKDDITLVHKIGTNDFAINGENVTFDAASVLEKGRTMVPLRVIAESLDGIVFWGKTGTATTIGIAN